MDLLQQVAAEMAKGVEVTELACESVRLEAGAGDTRLETCTLERAG